MSEYNKTGFDEIKKINVRIGPTSLVATTNITSIKENKQMQLKCIVTSKLKQLDYCRFQLPNGNSFSLNEKITEDKYVLKFKILFN